jgi:hypothetical protein
MDSFDRDDQTTPLLAGALLESVVAFVRRYVVLSATQADATALWIAHTHAIPAAETTPYLQVTSAEKRSGKTRLLEVLELLVPRALLTVNISRAALFRVIEQEAPTLLLDEYDALFGFAANRRDEDLRALLNAGHRRGATVVRVEGQALAAQLSTVPNVAARSGLQPAGCGLNAGIAGCLWGDSEGAEGGRYGADWVRWPRRRLARARPRRGCPALR